MSRGRKLMMMAGIACGVFAASGATAQVLSPVLIEDEDLPGGPALLPTNGVSEIAVNGIGGWSVTTTAGGTTFVWGTVDGTMPAPIRAEGIIGDYLQTGIEGYHGLSDAGSVAYSPTCTNQVTGETGLDSIWIDDTPVLIEGLAAPADFWSFGSRPGVATATGEPYGVAGTTATSGGSTQKRVLVFGNPPQILLQSGDVPTGASAPIEASGSPIAFDVRMSETGANYIVDVVIDTSSTMDQVVVYNGGVYTVESLPLQESGAVPASIAVVPGETWSVFDYYGVNDAGQVMVTGATSEAEFLMIDGEFVHHAGRGDMVMVPGEGMVPLSSSMQAAYMNRVGDWGAIWNVNDGSGNREVVIVNDQVVAIEGQLVDWNGDGVIDVNDEVVPGVAPTIADITGIPSFGVTGPDGSNTIRAVFTADVDVEGTSTSLDNFEALFVVELPSSAMPSACPCDRDGSQVQDLNDYFAYLGEFLNQLDVGNPQPGSADFDGSGFVDLNDYFAFLGCLPDLAAMTPCP